MSKEATDQAVSGAEELIPAPETLAAELPKDDLFRVLSLDGGGAKGFYILGDLKDIEGLLGCPLYKRCDLISAPARARSSLPCSASGARPIRSTRCKRST